MLEIYKTIKMMEEIIGDGCWVEFSVIGNMLNIYVNWIVNERLYKKKWVESVFSMQEIPNDWEHFRWLAEKFHEEFQHKVKHE